MKIVTAITLLAAANTVAAMHTIPMKEGLRAAADAQKESKADKKARKECEKEHEAWRGCLGGACGACIQSVFANALQDEDDDCYDLVGNGYCDFVDQCSGCAAVIDACNEGYVSGDCTITLGDCDISRITCYGESAVAREEI